MSHCKHPYGSGRDWEVHVVVDFQTVWDSGGTILQACEDNFNQLIFAVVLVALRLAMVSHGEVKLGTFRRTC